MKILENLLDILKGASDFAANIFSTFHPDVTMTIQSLMLLLVFLVMLRSLVPMLFGAFWKRAIYTSLMTLAFVDTVSESAEGIAVAWFALLFVVYVIERTYKKVDGIR